MTEGYSASKVLTWLLGILGALATVGVGASVGMLIDTGKKLASIEGAMSQNRDERRATDADLRSRIERLEARRCGEKGE